MAYAKKEDQLAYRRRWYKKNKEYFTKRNRKRKQEIRAWLREYKSSRGCQNCGETHPAVLEFHHRDPLIKEENIATTVNRMWGRERILKEIAKCDILCCNCHRKLESSSNG